MRKGLSFTCFNAQFCQLDPITFRLQLNNRTTTIEIEQQYWAYVNFVKNISTKASITIKK